jgi:hypothetical protein
MPPDRLGEEIHRASLHRVHRGRDVAVSREKDHRQWFVCLGQRLLQLQPAWSRHLQIEHGTTSGI